MRGARSACGFLRCQRLSRSIKIVLHTVLPCWWPLLLRSFDNSLRMAPIIPEQSKTNTRRVLLPTIFNALRVEIVESLQVIRCLWSVNIMPLLSCMHSKPLASGRRLFKCGERPFAMETCRVRGCQVHGDVVDVLHVDLLVLPIFIKQGVLAQHFAHVLDAPMSWRCIQISNLYYISAEGEIGRKYTCQSFYNHFHKSGPRYATSTDLMGVDIGQGFPWCDCLQVGVCKSGHEIQLRDGQPGIAARFSISNLIP